MPAITGIWATRHRPHRGLISRFRRPEEVLSSFCEPKSGQYRPNMLLRSGDYAVASNLLIATAVPIRSRLRPSVAAPIRRDRVRESRLASGFSLPRPPRRWADRPGERLVAKPPSAVASVGESLPMPRYRPAASHNSVPSELVNRRCTRWPTSTRSSDRTFIVRRQNARKVIA